MVTVPYRNASEAELGVREWVEGTAVFSWLGTPTFGVPEWPPPDRCDGGVRRDDHGSAGRRLARRLVRRSGRTRSRRGRSEFPMLPAVGRQVRW
ncbi:hypothetical protein OG792_12500 [Micromonospora sp. NBC_01699]|uniref:hypothetical protein n=1 Tax=Micromonospora sp. NBC_01699 TaxID=2975984 RepID=UPI002E33FBA9|nr:hypothetical protein [Micromonospora sp. NBC_01699]